MTNTKEDWTEAAAILQRAHDVLLEEGVSCKGTGLPLKKSVSFTGSSGVVVAVGVTGSPCLWHAIAQGGGMNWFQYEYYHKGSLYADGPLGLASASVWAQQVDSRLGTPTTEWNDNTATEDQVFDVLVEGRKYCEEQAGKL